MKRHENLNQVFEILEELKDTVVKCGWDEEEDEYYDPEEFTIEDLERDLVCISKEESKEWSLENIRIALEAFEKANKAN